MLQNIAIGRKEENDISLGIRNTYNGKKETRS